MPFNSVQTIIKIQFNPNKAQKSLINYDNGLQNKIQILK